jgi:tetratricopeptide (TPR) repeat protein
MLADVLIRNRLFDQAGEVLGKIQAEKREHPGVKLLLADLELCQGRAAQALEILDSIAQFDAGLPKLQFKRGAACMALQKWREAETCFLLALGDEPESPFVHNGLAQIYLMTSQPHKALEHALEAVGLMHYFPDAHFHLGVALAKLGRDDDAILAFETCERMTQGAAQPQAWLAELLRANNRDPERAREYEQKLRRQNEQPLVFVAGNHWSAWKKTPESSK